MDNSSVHFRVISIISLLTITLSITVILVFLGTSSTMPLVELTATYPWLPNWAITSITWVLNGIATASAVAAILGTFGLAAIASLVVSYARRYGVRYAIAW